MYEIVFTRAANKQLAKIPKKDQQKILMKIEGLALHPKPEGMKVLQGKLAQHFRIRSGNYRVIYSLENEQLIILILKIAHRKEIYE